MRDHDDDADAGADIDIEGRAESNGRSGRVRESVLRIVS
jgi:hypothetical protein